MKFVLLVILTATILLGCQPQITPASQQKFQISAAGDGLAWIIDTHTGDIRVCKAQKTKSETFDWNLGADCESVQIH